MPINNFYFQGLSFDKTVWKKRIRSEGFQQGASLDSEFRQGFFFLSLINSLTKNQTLN